ncbi:MAG: hypothetical protein D6832_02350 [Alphaproteobacteria bacterium]|nr:MAG: hypothetical protein D6832_02350 [Alphaproteobacteria bacterium]
MRNLFAFISGGLFGAGLFVSGMTDTAKVIGWLDIFGSWDPTLAFVLGGAIIPMAFAWLIAERRHKALLGSPIPARPEPRIGRNLMLGSMLFGFGWGMVGLCPGPSVAVLSYGGLGAVVFVVSMIAGMLVAPAIRRRLDALDAPARA